MSETVSDVKAAVRALRIVAKRLDEVALVVEAFVAKRLVVVALPRDAFVENSVVAVRAVDEALPKDDVPEMRVENVPVVNVGLEETAIVLVPEKVMLAPATRTESPVKNFLIGLNFI